MFQTLLGACADWPDAEATAWLRDQLVLLLFTGHETTGTALAWTLVLLAEHPDAMDRLREKFGDAAVVKGLSFDHDEDDWEE